MNTTTTEAQAPADRGRVGRGSTAGVLSSVSAILLLAACGGGDGSNAEAAGLDPESPTPVSIQFEWQPNVENMAVIVAEEHGYFEDEGLDIEIMPGGPEVTTDAQIVSGNADMGVLSSESLATAVINGAPLVGVGVMYQTSPSAIVSLEDSGIEEVSDLEGRTFGVSQTDTRVYEPFFESTNVDIDEIEMVDTGADPAALMSGEVDAMSAVLPNQPVVLRNRGYETNEIPLADHDYNRWSGTLVVRQDSLEQEGQREIVFAMARAIERGLQTAVDDPEAAGTIAYEAYANELGLEEVTQIEGAEIWSSLTTAEEREDGLLLITEEGVESQQEFFDQTGVDVEAREIFDIGTSQEVFDE